MPTALTTWAFRTQSAYRAAGSHLGRHSSGLRLLGHHQSGHTDQGDLSTASQLRADSVDTRRVGVRSRPATRWLAKPITFCDGHNLSFVTVTGQILMAVYKRQLLDEILIWTNRAD